MTLPLSGAISLSQVSVELGQIATATISLNDTAVRALFGVASGAISMSNGYGKSNSFSATITTNQTALNLRTFAIAAGWGGTSAATITNNTGVYIYSSVNSSPALTINGSWPGGVTFINNGFVIGMGGAGGAGGVYSGQTPTAPPAPTAYNGAAGLGGGIAVSLGVSVTIANNGTISGAGGGGGGGAIKSYKPDQPGDDVVYPWVGVGGGQGGGGRSGLTNSAGGNQGTLSAAGAGLTYSGAGGNWGVSGSAGSVPATPTPVAPITNYIFVVAGTPGSGGASGFCVALNGFTVTWTATGTRNGTIG